MTSATTPNASASSSMPTANRLLEHSRARRRAYRHAHRGAGGAQRRGIGSELVRGLLDIARAEGLKVKPRLPLREGLYRQTPGICGFARLSAGAAKRNLYPSVRHWTRRCVTAGVGVGFLRRHFVFLRPNRAGCCSRSARISRSPRWPWRWRSRRSFSSGSAASAAAACACKTILRALFPSRILAHASNQADIGYLFFNVFVFGIVFGWAVLSYQFISNGIIAGLVALFGPVAPSTLPAYRPALGHHADAVPRL